jgi:TRAP transporter TAXI family solute receptor
MRPARIPSWHRDDRHRLSARRHRRSAGLAAFAVAALAAAGVLGWVWFDTGGGAYRRGPITILTGSSNGVYYGYGVKLAQMINNRLPGVRATAVPTSGSVENLRRVSDEPNVFAFTAGDAATAAVNGYDPFTGTKPVRAVARIYDEYIHLVVRADGPIRSLAQLRGRRVSLGAPGSGTELVATRLFDVVPDLDVADVAASRLGLDESMAALRAGTVDAFFWQGGLPTAGVVHLAEQLPVRLVPLGGRADRLNMDPHWDPAYRQGTIPPGTYPGVDETLTIAMPDLLVTRADTDPDLVYETTRLLFATRAQLASSVPVADALDRRSAIATGEVALHDGALRYYRETKV